MWCNDNLDFIKTWIVSRQVERGVPLEEARKDALLVAEELEFQDTNFFP